MTHGFQDIAQEHTPTASAAFYIAQWEEIEPPSKPSAPRNRKGDWFETKRRGAEKSVGRYRRERRVIAIFVDEAEKKLNRQAAKAAKESQRGFG